MKYPILLPNIFNHPFTYESEINLKIGDYVVVPFGKSKITGVVWDEFEKNNNISESDLDLFQIADTKEEVIEILEEFHKNYIFTPNF